MADFVITPKVDETQEFIEIANDFANPLDLCTGSNQQCLRRESYGNWCQDNRDYFRRDCLCHQDRRQRNRVSKNDCSLFLIWVTQRRGDKAVQSEKRDMAQKSLLQCKKANCRHAAEPYPASSNLRLTFCKTGTTGTIPTADVSEEQEKTPTTGTKITIYGYNNNRRERFTHPRLRDHILWFTKFGSTEQRFGIEDLAKIKISLKGLDRDDFETLNFGHPFPDESVDVNKLFDIHTIQAPNFYCRRIIKAAACHIIPKSDSTRFSRSKERG